MSEGILSLRAVRVRRKKFSNFCRTLLTVNISEMADKEMKSFEEVIKYKLNFLPKGTEPFYAIQTYEAERGTDPPPTFYHIYETKDRIFSNDSYSFIEDITPLFIYISSCEKYYRENGHGKIDEITIKSISEDYKLIEYGFSTTHDGPVVDFKEHRISEFKRHRNFFILNEGY